MNVYVLVTLIICITFLLGVIAFLINEALERDFERAVEERSKELIFEILESDGIISYEKEVSE